MKKIWLVVGLLLALVVGLVCFTDDVMSDYSLYFDGAGAVTVSNASGVFTPQTLMPWAVSFWLKAEAQGAVILSTRYLITDTGWDVICSADGWVRLYVGGVAAAYIQVPDSPLNGRWNHVYFYFDPSGNCTPHLNGVAGSPSNVSGIGAITNVRDLTIGARSDSGGALSEQFHGFIDDVRFYGHTTGMPTAADVYNSGVGVKVSAAGVEDAWLSDCDDGEGTAVSGTLIDSGSSSSLNGAVSDAEHVLWFDGGVPFDSMPKVTKIIQDVYYKIARIQTGNGSLKDLTPVRSRRVDFADVVPDDGKVLITVDAIDPKDGAAGVNEWELTVNFVCFVVLSDRDTKGYEDACLLVMSEVDKKLLADPQRAGDAIDTMNGGNAIFSDGDWSGIVVSKVIEYRTVFGDPYSV